MFINATGTETRLRVRRVNEAHCIASAVRTARESGRPAIEVRHGGTVANAYRYPAATEGCVCIALPDGRSLAWLVRIPANKATLSGVCRAVSSDSAELAAVYYDSRYSSETWELARHHLARAIVAEIAAAE